MQAAVPARACATVEIAVVAKAVLPTMRRTEMAKAPSEAIVGREATEMTEEIAVNGTTGTIATTEGIEMTDD